MPRRSECVMQELVAVRGVFLKTIYHWCAEYISMYYTQLLKIENTIRNLNTLAIQKQLVLQQLVVGESCTPLKNMFFFFQVDEVGVAQRALMGEHDGVFDVVFVYVKDALYMYVYIYIYIYA